MRILATKIAAVESPFKMDLLLRVGPRHIYRVAAGTHTLFFSVIDRAHVRLESPTDLVRDGHTWRFIRQPFRTGFCLPEHNVRAEVQIPARGWQLAIRAEDSTVHPGSVAILVFHPKNGRVSFHYSAEHRELIWGPDRRVAGGD